MDKISLQIKIWSIMAIFKMNFQCFRHIALVIKSWNRWSLGNIYASYLNIIKLNEQL